MKRLGIPNIARQTGIVPKASSRRHLDALFNALALLLSLSGYTYAQELTGYLSYSHNRIQAILMDDAKQVIRYLKDNLKSYVKVVRGGTKLTVVVEHSGIEYTTTHSQSGLDRIALLRQNVKANLTADALLLFDRVVIAFFSSYRVIVTEAQPDTTTITNPLTGVDETVYIKETEIGMALTALHISQSGFKSKYSSRASSHGHRLITSAGVNGPATWTAYTDAVALIEHEETAKAFATFAEKSAMNWIRTDLSKVVWLENADTIPAHERKLGRLHSFSEWGGKTRNVAIVDYWTQTLLTPLHDTLFHFLRDIPGDGTFDQESVISRVGLWTIGKMGGEVHSFDLTAATDRLPLSLQEDVLGYLFKDKAMGKAWGSLLTARSYSVQDGDPVKYLVGQPMGAKSSWAMLALTHHVIVQVAARRAGLKEFSSYVIVGDDVTINSTAVANAYKSIIKGYGVAISDEKSILPAADLLPAGEICKRIFVNGKELTAIPPKLVVKASMNGRLLPQLQNELSVRGTLPTSVSALDFFGGLCPKDTESLEIAILLNGLPTSVSGLKGPVKLDVSAHKPESWYEGVPVTQKDIESAYNYVAITEQLKRVDALLRQTDLVYAIIKHRATGLPADKITSMGYTRIVVPETAKEKVNELPKLNYAHPVTKAVEAEVERIHKLLAEIKSGNAELATRARTGLLDMFRNSFVDAWGDNENSRAQAERSLVTRAMGTIDIVALEKKDHIVSFSIMLAYIERLWTVTFGLGKGVTINAVKSRVDPSADNAKVKITSLASSMVMSGRFRTGQLGQKPVSPTATQEVVVEGTK